MPPVRTAAAAGRWPMTSRVLAAPIDLNGTGHYLSWGFVQVSVANLIILGVIVLAFVAAVLLPFPGRRHDDD